jgi:zinc protease
MLMRIALSRVIRAFTPALLIIGLVPLAAQTAPAKPTAAAPAKPTPWLYEGSDIPADPAWTFGTLPNGLRYAVRRSGVPPRQVSIRVGMEVGSLFEAESERGYAHFIEHLSFRGSKHLSDGEAKRVWQRLGATFGSDTNALTSTTQTIYKLDLPSASPEALDESIKILSGMMSGPTMTQAEVDAERRTVLAEAREQSGPQTRVRDATQSLFFAGQRFADRSPIGTMDSLAKATPASLRAFHDRWYRPERAILVIAGDADPAQFKALIEKHFASWQGKGPKTPDPDFGKPVDGKPTSAIITEPGLPTIVSLATLRPWVQKNDTIAYNQGKLTDLVAIRIINRRLEERARAGGSYLQAQIDQEDVSRSVDGTFVSVVPLGNDWDAALRDVRAVIEDARINPPSPAEIDREAGEFFTALQIGVETERAEAAAKQADDILQAVDIRETVATAQVALDVFGGIRNKISPADILASTRKLLTGVGPRAILTTPTADPMNATKLATALTAPVTAQATAKNGTAVSFNQLASLGKPGKVTARKPFPGLGIEQISFANGSNLILFPNPAEQGKIYIQVRFGNGMQALSPTKPSLGWVANSAMIAAGVGPFDQNALDRLTSGRQINMDFDIGENSFAFNARTRAVDLKDQLKLIAAKLTTPRWDASPVVRTRAATLTGFDTLDATAQSVLSRDLGELLNGGDKRWASPSRKEIEALTPAAFRAQWDPLLKTGPIEVLIFGDIGEAEAITAFAETFGAMAPRKALPVPPAQAGSAGPRPTTKPIIRTHKGAADQAYAVIAWPLGGGMEGVYEARKLEMLAQIFNDRMFDKFREAEGASYSPNVGATWPLGMTSGGNFTALSQVDPKNVDRFFALTKEIAADLAANPVTADELARVVNPMRELIARASSGNTFWLNQLAGISRDPRKLPALMTLVSDYERISVAELQATAKRWLLTDKAMMVAIMPAAAAPASSGR